MPEPSGSNRPSPSTNSTSAVSVSRAMPNVTKAGTRVKATASAWVELMRASTGSEEGSIEIALGSNGAMSGTSSLPDAPVVPTSRFSR